MANKINTFSFTLLFTVSFLSCYTFPDFTPIRQVRIKFVGDLMCHSSQITSYLDLKTKTYDSFKSFEYVAESLQNANLTLGNLETTITEKSNEYSGYPRFGSPIGYLNGLEKAGFDILSTANNHSADKGSYGIDTTIQKVTEFNMIPIGSYVSLEDFQKRKDLIQDVNGIKIAIYNYTYSTNGIPVRDGRIVRILNEDQIRNDVKFAKEQGVHFIILWYHYGNEYDENPNNSQLKWVNIGIDAGADIIIGGHPHVVQKIDFYQDSNTNEDKLIAYSLGNFISAQNRQYTDGGIILSFTLEIGDQKLKRILNVESEPVWVNPRDYRIIPIKKYRNSELPSKLPKHLEKRMYDFESHIRKIPGLGITSF
ncbi:CapA family protein [Leptospira levettii]|uniref:CapA family protein n=1 Tax=Leptospira levettii TaxID=2023178 RepID=UPI00108343E0|nr:CapA family protein [Leptospira levettii]MCW7507361.1 CapA family protein [Leptospira levettii]MCW7518451.1 CapA family protein [Leptospira levettii]TGK99164.1 CapA family protein [Leptospira levettii]TGL17306.1 CapA family protein [Leptospira levettii]